MKEIYEKRREDAKLSYAQGMKKVSETPCPPNQKYPPGTRVWIRTDMDKFSPFGPKSMSHFDRGKWATINYTYAHAYGGDNVDSYCLNIDNIGSVAWYYENQLNLEEI